MTECSVKLSVSPGRQSVQHHPQAELFSSRGEGRMQCGPGMLKGRCCCVLFRDLQVLLLRDMSGHRDTEAPSTQSRTTEDSVLDTAVAELSKDKRDERFSFISYAEGTPVCRICFQGPEQVHSFIQSKVL